MSQRVAPFDSAASEAAASLTADRQKRGRPADFRDTMIAGIVLATHATLVTRNTRHFQEIPVVNPWDF